MDEFTFRYRAEQSIKVTARPNEGYSSQMILDGLSSGKMEIDDNPLDSGKVIRTVPPKGMAGFATVAVITEYKVKKERDHEFMLDKINVPVPVDLSDVELMISEGLESIGYWASKVNVYNRGMINVTGQSNLKYVGECLITGAYSNGERNFEINFTDMPHLAQSLGVMATDYPEEFQEFRDSQIDDEMGDLFLQLCAFGRKVF